MEVEILQGKKVGRDEGVPGPLGFFPCKKRQIVLVLDLQLFFLQIRSLCYLFCWVLPQLVLLLRVPKGLPSCLLVSMGCFRERKQQFVEPFHFVMTYEQKESLTACTHVWY